LGNAKNNYTIIEREVHAMIFSYTKYKQYLLANRFKFYVSRHDFLYLVNKPCTTGRIKRWFLLLHEFEFEIVVRKGNQNLMEYHLSRIRNGEFPTGVDDELPNATLFKVYYVLECYTVVFEYLRSGIPPPEMSKVEARKLIRRVV